MEWANGDIRVGTGRAPPRPKVHETVVDMHGYPPARDYPPQTHLDYGSVGVPRAECTPKHCGYGGPPTSGHHPYGITHPNYQTSGSAPGAAPPIRASARVSGGAACEYRPACYSSADRPPRTDLGPPPDIHPEVRPAEARPPPDVHRDVPPELRQEARPECYEARGGRSHHASHCDLREFQEWRELRGSRESVGTLPPELESHLRECRCPCDHLGYGNYQLPHPPLTPPGTRADTSTPYTPFRHPTPHPPPPSLPPSTHSAY
ncbi:uncharacterized protein LOC135092973 [Scylla paramamosain]|uniref:uncharacterized protein LOC135092973 n=1 Tax=Scylla paramamosain TaxID=85552 RepID=UPI0030830C87